MKVGESEIDQFADDTSFICKFESQGSIPLKFKKVLKQRANCLPENQLTLNADKAWLLILQ